MKSISILICILFISVCFGQIIPRDSLYLEQTPPGNTPKIFQLPISSGLFGAERIAISPDGKEIYYSELNDYPPSTLRIKYFRYFNNQWNGPFNLFEGYMAPGLSLSGDTLFIEKLQSGGGTPYTYISLRNDTAWSVPFKFMPGDQSYKHNVQITNSGNCYLSSNPPGSIGGLDWCRLVDNNTDSTIQTLGLPLNTSSNDADFYISRDESFIILSSFSSAYRSCYGYLDLFISYRKENNTWTNPKNLGPTINVNNTLDGRWGPYVTADGKYLFYSRGITPADGGINWIRIDNLIDSLKHTNFIPYVKNQVPDQTVIKDSTINYQIPDSTFVDDDGNNTLRYDATLSRGNTLPAWLSFDSLACIFSGTPDTAATYTIKVTATDTAGGSASCTFKITVTNPLSGIEEEKVRLPQGFTLDQNYPNPFNPTTTIRFTIAKSGRYSLSVFNMVGQQISQPINSHLTAGIYRMNFNGNGLSSGIYTYKLTGDNVSLTKKMLLVK